MNEVNIVFHQFRCFSEYTYSSCTTVHVHSVHLLVLKPRAKYIVVSSALMVEFMCTFSMVQMDLYLLLGTH